MASSGTAPRYATARMVEREEPGHADTPPRSFSKFSRLG
jgi:hypothetical protein